MELYHTFLRQRENCFLAWRQESNIGTTEKPHKNKNKANPYLWCNKYWHYLTVSHVVLLVLICRAADPVVEHLLWRIKAAEAVKSKGNFSEISKNERKKTLTPHFKTHQAILFSLSSIILTQITILRVIWHGNITQIYIWWWEVTLVGIFLPVSKPGPLQDLQLSTVHCTHPDGCAAIIFYGVGEGLYTYFTSGPALLL